MFSRRDYLDSKCTFAEYYRQFYGDSWPDRIAEMIGPDRLISSKDEHLNDIWLGMWDRLPFPATAFDVAKDLSIGLSLSDRVCINKQAARDWIDSNKLNKVLNK